MIKNKKGKIQNQGTHTVIPISSVKVVTCTLLVVHSLSQRHTGLYIRLLNVLMLHYTVTSCRYKLFCQEMIGHLVT